MKRMTPKFITIFLAFIMITAISFLFSGQISYAGRQRIPDISHKYPTVETLDVPTGDWGAVKEGEVSVGPVNCQYGVALIHGDADNDGTPEYNVQRPWLPTSGAGWYLDFQFANTEYDSIDYVPIIKVGQKLKAPHPVVNGWPVYDPDNYLPEFHLRNGLVTLDSVTNLAASNPGRLWLVGNEPDRFAFQDDVHPEIYAIAYHEVYHALKAGDPTAQVGFAGLVQMSPGRLQYVDIAYDAYYDKYGTDMPVDVWNAHIYVLPERSVINPNDPLRWGAHVALGTRIQDAKFWSGNNADNCDRPFDSTYCFSEHTDIRIVNDQIASLRQWMAAHGQRNKPLIISEYGVLYGQARDQVNEDCYFADEFGDCFSEERSIQFMRDSFELFETATDTNIGYPLDDYKLVQKWIWFSMSNETGVGSASNMLKNGYEAEPSGDVAGFRQLGLEFRQMATEDPLVPNLAIESTTAEIANGNLELSVNFRNTGNTHLTDAFTVTFYSDADMTQAIGSAIVPGMIKGCSIGSYEASVIWVNPPANGFADYYVKVDAGNAIGETSESDNIASGQAIADPVRILLPIVNNEL